MKNLHRSILSYTLIIFSLLLFAIIVTKPVYANNEPVELSLEAPPQININTASVEQLAKNLNGIGISKAKKIVEYRETFGPFVTVEQLREVSGIGQSILDKNMELITLH